MKFFNTRQICKFKFTLVFAFVIFCTGLNGQLFAQFGGGGVFLNNGGVVGGVEINPDGVLSNSAIRLSDDIKEQIDRGLNSLDSDIGKAGMRMISLNALEQKMIDCKNNGKPFPPSVMFMAGLQRIEYVIVSPENNDVIIAGPGEGFKTDEQGNVVGAKSGMPVIHLQDFLIAMRHVESARKGFGISVSIDPSKDGIENVNKMLRNYTASSFNDRAAKELEDACGPQKITLTGVPKNSRFSQVLVAADYKMKRLAMGLERSPEFLPSLLAIAQAKNARFNSMSPRFWMEANYEPVSVSDDKKVWKLNGQGVCTKTQEEFMSKNGQKSVKPNKLATKWANSMTEQFNKLSEVEPVFRELRNLMDISVVAAIIAKERMLEQANLSIPAINGTDTVATPSWNVPQTVPTQCSFARMTRSLMVTTSGGVTINSWQVASNTVADNKITKFSNASNTTSDRWWWNVN